MQYIHNIITKPFIAPEINISNRKIIVTGCSKGSIGYEIANILVKWGCTVIITTRSDPKEIVLSIRDNIEENCNIYGHSLDLCNTNSVVEFVSWYKQTYGEELDILINNAGIHLDILSKQKYPYITEDGYEIHWRTNYLGTMHLTYLLLPLLSAKGNKETRIINVVSNLHCLGTNKELLEGMKNYNSYKAYALSKLALIHATKEIQKRYTDKNIKAYCLHPGEVFTNIAFKSFENEYFIRKIRNALRPIEKLILLSPVEGAQTALYLATNLDIPKGLYYVKGLPINPSKEIEDDEVSKILWNETIKWIESL